MSPRWSGSGVEVTRVAVVTAIGQPANSPTLATVRVDRFSRIIGCIEAAPAPVKRSIRPRWIPPPRSEAYQ